MRLGADAWSYSILTLLGALCYTPLAENVLKDVHADRCLDEFFPENRSGFPALLSCLGLHSEAVEVGVQAGVHAHAFLDGWGGKRLRLVDTWRSPGDALSSQGRQMFYVDIANVNGPDAGKQHKAQCEARLSDELASGRAELVNLDSIAAASGIADGELDFVYLDARHDFAGVVADVRAWWPKVKVGGIFAGHDFVDGEFPEGDFFWISALHAVLPELTNYTYVTREKNRYPSFFVIKSAAFADIAVREIETEKLTRRLYSERSRYLKLWTMAREDAGLQAAGFLPLCRERCGEDCQARGRAFTPTRTAGSTLRPFACGLDEPREAAESSLRAPARSDSCGAEMLLDIQAYMGVCSERCDVTCQQREKLFRYLGEEMQSV